MFSGILNLFAASGKPTPPMPTPATPAPMPRVATPPEPMPSQGVYVERIDPRFVGPSMDDPLLRTLSVDELLALNTELVQRIRATLSFRDDGFDRIVMPILRRVADYANLIPGSESDHHCTPGGLLQHLLEAGFFAAQITDDMVFALDETPQRRREIELLWRFAAFGGGICHDIGKAIESVRATSLDRRLEWEPFLQPLTSFLQENDIKAFRMTWNHERQHKAHEKYAAFLCSSILGPEGIQHLVSVKGAGVLEALIEALQGGASAKNPLRSIIARADSMSIEADFDTRRANRTPANAQKGLGFRLMQLAMLRIRDGYWRPNTPGNPIWVAPEGVYAVVPAFYAGIEAAADAADEPGIPRYRVRLVAELTRAGLIEADPEGNPILVTLRLPTNSPGATVVETGVRLLRPDLVLGDVAPPPPVSVLAPIEDEGPAPTPKAGRAKRAATATPPVADPADEQGDLFCASAEASQAAPAGAAAPVESPEAGLTAAPAEAGAWLQRQGAAGEVVRAILDANLATTGPVQVHMQDGRMLVETTGLVQELGFGSGTVVTILQKEEWLERNAPGQNMRFGFEANIAGRPRMVFAINREISAIAMQYAPSLFDGSRARSGAAMAADSSVTKATRKRKP